MNAAAEKTDLEWMGADDLRDELEKTRPLLAEAVAALKSLCDQDALYSGDTIHIRCDSHSDAIKRMRVARDVITKAAQS